MPQKNDRIFSADSMMWRVCREHAILLHGPAAAVMQVAHPRIGVGVLEHSDFQSSPTARLDRTLDTVYTIVFGTRSEAQAAAQRVHGIHERVNGDASWHGIPGDERDSAIELDLFMWVIATMIVSSIDGYERAVGRLSEGQKQEFYRDMRTLGTFFDLPAEHGPSDWKEFVAYWEQQLARRELGAHPVSRKVAWAVARPRRPWWLWVGSWPVMFMFTEIIPEPVRGRLEFSSTWLTRTALGIATWGLRVFVKIAPRRVRFVPHYLRAMREIASAAPRAREAMGESPMPRQQALPDV